MWKHWGLNINEYWSEEPNVTTVQGITYHHIADVLMLDDGQTAIDHYQLGQVVALAFNEPKRLVELIRPKIAVTLESVHPMLRPRKRNG